MKKYIKWLNKWGDNTNMINKKEKLKLMSIINICNQLKIDDKFWIIRIKEICEELLK